MCKVAKSCFLLVIPLGLFTLHVLAESPGVPNAVLFVDDSATGANDGSSWTDAFVDLQLALELATELGGTGVEILVANGIYKPSKRTVESDSRSATFTLPNGIVLRGGHTGEVQTAGEIRETLLTGDLLGNDDYPYELREDNVHHVLTVPLVIDLPTLEGVSVRGGHTTGFGGGLIAQNGVQLVRCRFEENVAGMPYEWSPGTVAHVQGGGAVAIMASEDSGTAIDMCWESCHFARNISNGTGGAVFAAYANITMQDCVFEYNAAETGGGIGTEWFGRLTLERCLFNGNRAAGIWFDNAGGAIMVNYDMDALDVSESYFWGNEGHQGGAIHVPRVAGNVAIRNSTFYSNRATHAGGAFAGNMAAFTVEGCQFEDNSSEFGGAIALPSYEVPMHISNSAFNRNTAIISGGALELVSNNLTVEACAFDKNQSSGSGGAIHAEGKARFINCIFSSNGASGSGGALVAMHDMEFSGCTFQQNWAASGGSVFAISGPFLFDQCKFGMNSATSGGGLFLNNPDYPAVINNSLFMNNYGFYGAAIAGGAGDIEINRSTVVHNTASVLGGALIGGPGTKIRNSILWDNVALPGGDEQRGPFAQIEGLEDVEVDFSTVEGWSEAIAGVGNRADDPLLVHLVEEEYWFRPFDGDLRLGPNSPARNAGDLEYVAASGDADLDGHARVLCGAVDMGAYESGFGDADCDGQVNPWDFAVWVACAEGEIEGAACETMDSDVDSDFDLKDFAAVQNGW